MKQISILDNDIRIKIKLKNAEGLFGVKSEKKEKLPFNSLVQFNGHILNVSIIKKINTDLFGHIQFICRKSQNFVPFSAN